MDSQIHKPQREFVYEFERFHAAAFTEWQIAVLLGIWVRSIRAEKKT
jgi:hypothetical protein